MLVLLSILTPARIPNHGAGICKESGATNVTIHLIRAYRATALLFIP